MSFDSFINKGSSYFAGKDVSPPTITTNATNFYKNVGPPFNISLPSMTWTQPNWYNTYDLFSPIFPGNNFLHSSPNNTITYTGNSGLFYIFYSISGQLQGTTANLSFAIYINSELQYMSLANQLYSQNLLSTSAGVMTILNPDDVITLQAFLDGSADTFVEVDAGLSIFQIN